uniref:FAM192A/Fyv6 N-terminal domain-containing protein n=1 Tax=Trichuris muris TaxID=70415 RepID=A0A5S6Q009_TRIMR
MSEFRSFVSQFEIDQEKKRRQEEWERVRRPDQPREAPEPEVDARPLYVRLREQREKAQLEFDEAMKLQHSVRGLDDDELEFIEQVDRIRSELDRKIRSEEQAMIQAVRQAMVNPVSSASNISVAPTGAKRATSGKGQSKQATLLAGAIRRKGGVQKPVPSRSSLANEQPASSSACADDKICRGEPVQGVQAALPAHGASRRQVGTPDLQPTTEESTVQLGHSNHVNSLVNQSSRGRKRPLEPNDGATEAPKR